MIKNNILLEKYKDYFLLEKAASDKAKDANANSTHRSNVNEYLLAHELGVLAGHGGTLNRATGLSTRPGFTEADKAASEKKYLASKKMISPDEHKHQWERAKEMAKASHKTFLNRPHEHGGPINLKKATHFAVSAGADAISKLTGDTSIDSKENTSDVIGKVPGKKGSPDIFPGVSAKSNVGSTEEGGERFSNRAVTGIADNLKMPDLHQDVADSMEDFSAKHNIDHLPMSSKSGAGGRKENIRKNPKIVDDAEYYGSENKKNVRNKIHDWINEHGSEPSNPEGVHTVRRHLLDHHFREAGSSHPTVPFITVSGHGTSSDKNSNKSYGAHGHFSYENPRVQLLNDATHISAMHAGDYGMHIFAHTQEHPEGVHVMKLDSKWNSQPMASSMKVVGTERDTRKRRTDFEQKREAAAARAANPTAKRVAKPKAKKIVESYGLSDDDAFQMLILGTDMDEIDLNENHKNYLKDGKGNVRIFKIRGIAAKEAHQKGGQVVPYGRGYAVLLEEKQNDYHVFEKSIRSESGYDGGKETSSRSTILVESTERGSATGSGSERGETSETGEQSNAERKITFTFKELCERNFKNKNITEEKKVKQFSNDDTLNKAREIAANREKDVDDALDKATSLNQKAEYQLSRNKEALAGLKAIPKDSTVHFDPETGHWRGRDKNNNPVAGGPVTRNGMRNAANTMRAAQQRESINNGESGLSMASSGENMMRGSIRNKTLKKPLEELTGDETGASIGDQKEDELKKKGISLVSFKNRNFV